MWGGSEKKNEGRGFWTPPAKWRQSREVPLPSMPISERRPRTTNHSPYVKAKHVQLIEKDPSRAISLFWASINAGDRIESSLKDMAVVMKQLNRSEEAIEAIKSFRHLCPHESQHSLDNVLLELYKSTGRIQEEIEMLQLKLKHIEEGIAFGGKQTRIARSQGRRVQITIEKEYSRLLGNLAWVFMQQKDYKSAEESYRKALSIELDKNKQCNLAICLIHMNKIAEAKFLLRTVQLSADNGADESYAKSFERAFQMIDEIDSQTNSAVGMTTACNKKSVAYESSPSPFTQPRRSQALQCSSRSTTGRWLEQNGDHFSRKLSFEKPVGQMESLSLGEGGGGGGDYPQGPSKVRRSLELREIVRNSMENLKATQHLDESPKPATHVILEREIKKKSWADMVEEDYEQEKEQCGGKYNQKMTIDYPHEGYPLYRTPNKFTMFCKDQQLNDENVNANVIVDSERPVHHYDPQKKDAERTESSLSNDRECGGYVIVDSEAPVKHNDPQKRDAEKTEFSLSDDPESGGYCTQPGNHVRHSLTFPDHQHQNTIDNEQNPSSPLEKKVLNVDTYASVLCGGGSSTSLKGVGVKLLGRSSRLQVFRDITPESPRAS